MERTFRIDVDPYLSRIWRGVLWRWAVMVLILGGVGIAMVRYSGGTFGVSLLWLALIIAGMAAFSFFRVWQQLIGSATTFQMIVAGKIRSRGKWSASRTW